MSRRAGEKRRAFSIFNYDGNNGRRIGGAALRKALGFRRYHDAPHHVFYDSRAALIHEAVEVPTPRWGGHATDAEMDEVRRLFRKGYRDEFGVSDLPYLDAYHDDEYY